MSYEYHGCIHIIVVLGEELAIKLSSSTLVRSPKAFLRVDDISVGDGRFLKDSENLLYSIFDVDTAMYRCLKSKTNLYRT